MRINSYITAGKQIAKAADGNEAEFYKGLEEYAKGHLGVEYKTLTSNDEKTVERAVTSLGYLRFGMVFSTILIMEDKVSGVFERVLISPLKTSSYLFQHVFSYFIVAFIQIYSLLAIVPRIINIEYGSTSAERYQILLVCCAFALVCISIGVTISRFSKNALMAGTIASLINLPMLMLGGCLWPLEIMPEAVQKIGNFMPTTWFLKAGEAVLYGRGISAASSEIMYMILFSVILLVINFLVKTAKD
ncbi:ABC transporter permease [Enterococcus sp. AZ126]|uniref:ABC transporter permease n=1 Tax=Enterococcus sp. AZ126 TaxID=2774635 RepID=UPI003F22DA18